MPCQTKNSADDDRDRQQDVERAAGEIDPEIADGLRRAPGEAADQRDRQRDAGGRGEEIMHREPRHLDEVAHGRLGHVGCRSWRSQRPLLGKPIKVLGRNIFQVFKRLGENGAAPLTIAPKLRLHDDRIAVGRQIEVINVLPLDTLTSLPIHSSLPTSLRMLWTGKTSGFSARSLCRSSSLKISWFFGNRLSVQSRQAGINEDGIRIVIAHSCL